MCKGIQRVYTLASGSTSVDRVVLGSNAHASSAISLPTLPSKTPIPRFEARGSLSANFTAAWILVLNGTTLYYKGPQYSHFDGPLHLLAICVDSSSADQLSGIVARSER